MSLWVYKPTTPIFYCSQSVLVFYSRPLENNRKWVWWLYKQHNNLVVGLVFEIQDLALGLEFQYKTSHSVIILYVKTSKTSRHWNQHPEQRSGYGKRWIVIRTRISTDCALTNQNLGYYKAINNEINVVCLLSVPTLETLDFTIFLGSAFKLAK